MTYRLYEYRMSLFLSGRLFESKTCCCKLVYSKCSGTDHFWVLRRCLIVHVLLLAQQLDVSFYLNRYLYSIWSTLLLLRRFSRRSHIIVSRRPQLVVGWFIKLAAGRAGWTISCLGFCFTCSTKKECWWRTTCSCPMTLAAAFVTDRFTVWSSSFGHDMVEPEAHKTPLDHKLGLVSTADVANLQTAFG